MKKYSSKKAFLLLTGAASGALLSGCGDLRNPFGDQRSGQMVPGERHLPPYNQIEIQRAAQMQGAPPESASMPPPSMLAVPHNGGANYGSSSASPSQADSSSSSLGSLNPAPVKVATTVRKPLSENIYAGRNNTPASVDQPLALRTSPAVMSPSGPTVSVNPDETTEPSSGPSFFSRIFGSASDKSADNISGKKTETTDAPLQARSAISDDEKNAPYAPLSSVPQTPPEFKSIKASRDQDIQDLRSEHGYAQAQQQQLGNEPSQQQGVTAVEMPQPAVVELAPAPMPVVPAPTNQQFPRTPQRGVDIMTQDDWNALQKARQLQQSMPQPEQNFTPAPAVEAPTSRAPYWWEGWGASSSHRPSEPTDAIQDNGKSDNAPQSALSVATESVVVNQPESGNIVPSDGDVLSSSVAVANSDEEQPHRASFFSRLLGRSSTPDAPDNTATAALPPPEDSPKEVGSEKAIPMLTPLSDTQNDASVLPSPNIIKRVKYTPVPFPSGEEVSSPSDDK